VPVASSTIDDNSLRVGRPDIAAGSSPAHGRLGGAMTSTTADPTLDRMLRHMAWANAQLVARLLEQPTGALALTAPENEWSAGRILAHLLNAAQGYGSRLSGAPRPPDAEPPTSTVELADLGARLATADATLRIQATEPARRPHRPSR
jgi:DinB superfamily